MFCKYCGHELSDDSAFCSACGKSLTAAPKSDTVKITFFRESQLYLINPPININIDGKKMLSIANGETLELDMDKGPHSVVFSQGFRKKTLDFTATEETCYTIKWDRMTGSIRVN